VVVFGVKKPKIIGVKRYSTEEKVRKLRHADAGQSIGDIRREHNISEVSFNRWKQFAPLEANQNQGQEYRDPSIVIWMGLRVQRSDL